MQRLPLSLVLVVNYAIWGENLARRKCHVSDLMQLSTGNPKASPKVKEQ